MYNYYGTDEKDLAKFDMKLSEFIISADRIQSKSREFITHEPNVMSDIFNDLAQDATNRPDMNQVLFVNLPICDLSDLELEWEEEACFIHQGDPSTGSLYQFQDCLQVVVLETCIKYSLDGKPWPYDQNMHGFD